MTTEPGDAPERSASYLVDRMLPAPVRAGYREPHSGRRLCGGSRSVCALRRAG